MKKVISGNEAAAYGVMLCCPKVICAYPITPQSRIPELLSEWCAQGVLGKTKFVNVDSETTALAYVMAASAGGVRVFAATSSQGMALMHEQLHWSAGARLPIVLANVNRSLYWPGGVGCDQSDSLSQRDTGWLQLYCESNQEVLDTIIQAYRIAESVSLPVMVCFDGIYLSYIQEGTEIPEQELVNEYLPPYEPKFRIPAWGAKLYFKHPSEFPSDLRLGLTVARYEIHKSETKSMDVFFAANEEFQRLFGRGYPAVEEYKCEDADLVVVISGSAVGTGKTVVDKLRQKGHKVGLVKLKMFRPFPRELIRKVLAGRKKVVVIERDFSPAVGGIFCQEIKAALYGNTTRDFPPIYGFVSGLGGGFVPHQADITPQLIEKAILYTLTSEPPSQDVIWLGLQERGGRDEYDRNAIKLL